MTSATYRRRDAIVAEYNFVSHGRKVCASNWGHRSLGSGPMSSSLSSSHQSYTRNDIPTSNCHVRQHAGSVVNRVNLQCSITHVSVGFIPLVSLSSRLLMHRTSYGQHFRPRRCTALFCGPICIGTTVSAIRSSTRIVTLGRFPGHVRRFLLCLAWPLGRLTSVFDINYQLLFLC